MLTEAILERGLLPDHLVRLGIRRLLRRRLRHLGDGDAERQQQLLVAWLEEMDRSPIAVDQDSANAQHYEVPAEFYRHVLGPHLKYSCGLWSHDDSTLEQAEAAMLDLTCQRNLLRDGMRVLELGCGWGSLSLWLAERYPRCRITAVSNSHGQRQHIERQRDARGLDNLTVVTADVATFEPGATFDRVFSVEMFEHLRNWREMFHRMARWLSPDGRIFLHVFTHRAVGYPFTVDGDGDWMARHFFTGGQMPADSQPLYLQDDLAVERHWRVDGRHYARTAEAWLRNHDRNRAAVESALRPLHGGRAAAVANSWRVFFLACAELWGFRSGSEWFVSHYRIRRKGDPAVSEEWLAGSAHVS
ncbi:MAG: class I SAM-dependent methyltransferase [Planctomycetes bacterium]|nr:class I SAM-dependent methyltransferase [Planctomycetota bacterium]